MFGRRAGCVWVFLGVLFGWFVWGWFCWLVTSTPYQKTLDIPPNLPRKPTHQTGTLYKNCRKKKQNKNAELTSAPPLEASFENPSQEDHARDSAHRHRGYQRPCPVGLQRVTRRMTSAGLLGALRFSGFGGVFGFG